jgi:hypothetical protein
LPEGGHLIREAVSYVVGDIPENDRSRGKAPFYFYTVVDDMVGAENYDKVNNVSENLFAVVGLDGVDTKKDYDEGDAFMTTPGRSGACDG